MKIRNDFVTNSSSSSFILGFTSEETVVKELHDGFPKKYKGKYARVKSDVQRAERLTKEEAMEKLEEEALRWEAEWQVMEFCEWKRNMSYREAWEYVETEEGKKEIQSLIDDKKEEIKQAMDGNSVFVAIEYGDDVDSDMEHEIMPQVKSTIYRISYH